MKAVLRLRISKAAGFSTQERRTFRERAQNVPAGYTVLKRHHDSEFNALILWLELPPDTDRAGARAALLTFTQGFEGMRLEADIFLGGDLDTPDIEYRRSPGGVTRRRRRVHTDPFIDDEDEI